MNKNYSLDMRTIMAIGPAQPNHTEVNPASLSSLVFITSPAPLGLNPMNESRSSKYQPNLPIRTKRD